MSKLVVHIGLPKTATTSLQKHIFEPLETQGWRYLGVRQPRDRAQDELFQAFMRHLGSELPPARWRDLRAEFTSALGGISSVLLSEEGICLDSSTTWQEKLSRLRKATAGLETEILVTIRNPREAAYSLYVEMHRQLRRSSPTFGDFLRTNQARIFDYKYFLSLLYEMFQESHVVVVPFELSQRGNQYLSTICSRLGLAPPVECLPKENLSPETGAGKQTKGTSLLARLNEALGESPKSRLLKNAIPKQVSRRLASLLGRVELPRSSYAVPPPTAVELRLLADLLGPSMAWANNRFGCEY